MNTIIEYKVGEKYQYNDEFLTSEIVELLKIDGNNCLVIFPNGLKICTRLSGLKPLKTK